MDHHLDHPHAERRPFNITTGSDVNGDGNNNDRPNLRTRHCQVNDTGGSRVAAMNSWVSATPFCTFHPATGSTPALDLAVRIVSTGQTRSMLPEGAVSTPPSAANSTSTNR
jgi:hypothetical protein